MEEKNKRPKEKSPSDDNKTVGANQEPEDKQGNYMAEGMALGMCAGVAAGLLLFDNLVIGIAVGMCLGLAVGSNIKKKKTK